MHSIRGMRVPAAVLVLCTLLLALVGSQAAARSVGQVGAQSRPQAAAPAHPAPVHLTHPCGGMLAEPPFLGLSPLSITAVPGMCANGYGDIGVWQAGGHSYVVLSGFSLRMFHIFNVDNPYAPVPLVSQVFPTGGTTSTSVFPFHQGANQYISVTMRGSGSGCGYFVYGVNDPANPLLVTRFQGTDWCTPHEHFVSTDANGNADYAWLTMSAEGGSGYKVVVLDLHNLPTLMETGRYQRPDAGGSIFAHDVTVIGNRVFLAHWGGGVQIFDKQTLASTVNPTPLNPIDSIRPAAEGGVAFNVHHAWPTSDGNHLLIEDEFRNQAGLEKIKIYNIRNVAAPIYEGGISGPDPVAQITRAHNLKIQPITPGHDRLYVGWYQAGTRGFEIDTTGSNAVVTPTIMHQLKDSPNGQFGNVWGVDYLPCVLSRGGGEPHPTTCVYSSDMTYGLVADALGEDPSLDPYAPEPAISDPVAGQVINGCSYTIQGNAHDYYSGVAAVEVSTDGTTWAPATGITTWTYGWTAPGNGSYNLNVRARDMAGNLGSAATTVAVTVSGCTPASATPIPPKATPTAQPPSATAFPPTATATVAPPNATAAPPTVAPTVTPTVCAAAFSDVQAADYFASAVHYLACRGVISGYSDGTFRPYRETTRGQVAKIAMSALDLPPVTPVAGAPPTFSDVDTGNVFYGAIETAAAHGIVGGYACGGRNPQTGAPEPCDSSSRPYYRPATSVTRGQLTKIIVLSAGWPLLNPTTATFPDVPRSNVFYSAIQTAVCHGILSGYSDGLFRPTATATRGQIAKIAYGALLNPAPGCTP